jgi:two-component system cell cycle response regulator DivK
MAESKLILLVEDNEACARMFGALLRETLGLRVLRATDGLTAVGLALKHRPDVVHMDMQLPFFSGWESIQRFRMLDELKEIPIFVVTATMISSFPFWSELCDLTSGQMTKPVSIETYCALVRRSLGLKTPLRGRRLNASALPPRNGNAVYPSIH